MERHHDWPIRLGRIIESARELSFEWGVLDCALHVCNCIRAITVEAVDPAAQYRGVYSDEAGAQNIFGSDLAGFAAATAAALGMPEVAVTFAGRGDVVFIDNDTAYGALGVVALDGRFASCMSDKGLAFIPMRRWKRAWRVG